MRTVVQALGSAVGKESAHRFGCARMTGVALGVIAGLPAVFVVWHRFGLAAGTIAFAGLFWRLRRSVNYPARRPLAAPQQGFGYPDGRTRRQPADEPRGSR